MSDFLKRLQKNLEARKAGEKPEPAPAPEIEESEEEEEEEAPAPPQKITLKKAKAPPPHPEEAEEEEEAPAPVPTPAKRGRPSKKEETTAHTPAPAKRKTLIVGCLIDQIIATPFEEVAKSAHAMIQEATGEEHYSYLEYGKGPATFASAIATVLSEHPERDVIYCPFLTREVQDALPALLSWADAKIIGRS